MTASEGESGATDLEMVRRCAEAMDLGCYEVSGNAPEHTIRLNGSHSPANHYWPLTDDAQAMALVKRFRLACGWDYDGLVWCETPKAPFISIRDETDLNHAIVRCVSALARGD